MVVGYVSTNRSRNAGTQNFENSVARFGYDKIATRIGGDQKWRGWRHRMELYRDFCADKVDDDVWILLTDADDVIFVCPLDVERVVERIESFGKSLVFTAEQGPCFSSNCHTIGNYWKNIEPDVKTTNKFVNGGTVIGTPAALVEMFRWGLDRGFKDDQKMMGAYVDEFYDKVALDHSGVICYCVERDVMPKVVWDESQNFVQAVEHQTNQTRTSPILMHFAWHYNDYQIHLLTMGKKRPGVSLYNDLQFRILGDENSLHHWDENLLLFEMSRNFVIGLYFAVGIIVALVITLIALSIRLWKPKQCIPHDNKIG